MSGRKGRKGGGRIVRIVAERLENDPELLKEAAARAEKDPRYARHAETLRRLADAGAEKVAEQLREDGRRKRRRGR